MYRNILKFIDFLNLKIDYIIYEYIHKTFCQEIDENAKTSVYAATGSVPICKFAVTVEEGLRTDADGVQ